MLVHVLDLAPLDQSDPVANHATIEAELAAHDARLADLPRILALSKADLVTPEQAAAAAAQWSERLGADVPIHVTSSATGEGLEALALDLLRTVPALRVEPLAEMPEAEHMVFKPGGRRGLHRRARR